MIQNLSSKTAEAKFVFTVLFCEAHMIFFSYFNRSKHGGSEGSDDLWTHADLSRYREEAIASLVRVMTIDCALKSMSSILMAT